MSNDNNNIVQINRWNAQDGDYLVLHCRNCHSHAARVTIDPIKLILTARCFNCEKTEGEFRIRESEIPTDHD